MGSEIKLFHLLKAKLNLNSHAVIRKAQELLRLLKLKSNMGHLSEMCQIVICMDLAAASFGVPFDKIEAIKLAGVPKRVYVNNQQTIERLLGLEEKLSVQDLCVQFGVNEASSEAQNVLKRYIDQNAGNRFLDFNHPMYAVAAVFVTCRKCKISIDRAKLIEKSCVKKSSFLKLVATFEKHAESLEPKIKKKVTMKKIEAISAMDALVQGEMKDSKKEYANDQEKNTEITAYEDWKRNILKECGVEDQ